MNLSRARWWGVGRACLVASGIALFTGCATTTAPQSSVAPHDDEDLTQLIAQVRADLNRSNRRESDRKPAPTATPTHSSARDSAFADKARALFAPLSALRMPVVGVRGHDLYNSWGDPRDGGKRPHRGIDIFAPRGTPIVAVADGIISYIGDQPKGGHCIWLTTESGTSFYYAHLDRWAPGIYEGMEVESGDLLGFVGNTGNALTTPPHLHFAVNQNDEMVNPFPMLTKAIPVRQAQVRAPLGSGYGTR